jgi:hypothetical protein
MMVDSSSDDDSSSEGSDLLVDTSVFDRIDEDVPDDAFNYWLSEHHQEELLSSKDDQLKCPPPLRDWKEVDPAVIPSRIQVTIGLARRRLWEQGKNEILQHRMNVQSINHQNAASSNGIERVFQFMFGPSSKIAKLYMERLELSPADYFKFIITFMKSCRYGLSVKNLHDSSDNITFLMPTDDYNRVWKKIRDLPRHPTGESFWQEAESVLNNILMKLFMGAQLCNNDGRSAADHNGDTLPLSEYMIGLDDDKLHFAWQHGITNSDGLKMEHHTMDNRHGYTAHTACHSATATPVNVAFQREGEQVYDTATRIINQVFGQHTGIATRLEGLELAADRGYWLAKLVFQLLSRGADIHGTIKRMDYWVPMTYDRKYTEEFPEKSKVIDKKGYKDAYHMNLNWKGPANQSGRKVSCIAYRSGTGTAVSLAIASQTRAIHWDFIPRNDGDMRWYSDRSLSEFDRRKKGLKLLEGVHVDTYAEQVFDAMEPRTCDQGTADWFIDRQLSGTSSTIARLISSVAPLINENGVDNGIYEAFRTVLEYGGYNVADLLGSAVNDEDGDESNNGGDNDSDNNSNASDKSNLECKNQAKNWIEDLQHDALDTDDDFKAEMATLDERVLAWMVALIKKKPYKDITQKAATDFLKKWLNQPKERRPFEPLTVAQLQSLAKELQINYNGMKKPQLIAELLKPANEQRKHQACRGNNKKASTPSGDIPPGIAPLVTIFKQAYMRPQSKASDRSAASVGHTNEEPFLRAFFSECGKHNVVPDDAAYSCAAIKIKAIYRVGLMRKKGNNFAKASLDGILFAEDANGDIDLVPVEVKSRVADATREEATDKIEEYVGAELYQKGKLYLLTTSSSDDLLKLLIHDKANPRRKTNESFQLLHGAYVAGSSRGILLVGSRSKLMYAIDVRFEDELLEAYHKVVTYMYETFFAPFYELSMEGLQTQHKDTIDEALEHLDWIDEHAFWTTFKLWQSLNVDVNNNNIQFPLPACSRLLPIQHARWNILKGPSDTTTKLIDMVEEKLGVRTPRTVVTARITAIAVVAFHRSKQMLSAKKNLDKYPSLLSFRHAANERFGIAASLSAIIRFAEAELRLLNVAPHQSFLQVPIAPNTPPARVTRGTTQHNNHERVEWAFNQQVGCTPCRGRSVNDQHKARERQCDGTVLMLRVSDPKEPSKDARQPCRLCKTKTAFFCTGCKNYLCFGTQGINEKKAAAIANNTESPAPKPFIKIPYLERKTQLWTHFFAVNCCYAVSHKLSFDGKQWEAECGLPTTA